MKGSIWVNEGGCFNEIVFYFEIFSGIRESFLELLADF